MYDIEKTAERLKKLRSNANKTQETVANEIGVSVDTIRKHEQAVRALSLDMADIYADYYKTTVDFLINGSVNTNKEISDIIEGCPEQIKCMAIRIFRGIIENLVVSEE